MDPELKAALDKIDERLTALEHRTPEVSPEKVNEALENHDVFKQVKSFLEKWMAKQPG